MNRAKDGLALDTSVVIRLLVQQPVALYECAALFLEAQIESGRLVYVSDPVLAEAYFALQNYYQCTKADSLQMLCGFIQTPGISVSPVAQRVLLQPGLATAKPGFVDRLIHGTAHAAGQTLCTFEKASKKLPGTLVLG